MTFVHKVYVQFVVELDDEMKTKSYLKTTDSVYNFLKMSFAATLGQCG